MANPPTADAGSFRFTHDSEPGETLLCGFSEFGLAGLTAVDYLVDHLELEQNGHVAADDLPAITPFENGTPRHHTRLFSRPDLDVTVLVGELFVPVFAAEPFTSALADWLDASDVDEVAILSGVPIAHAPTDHRTFYVATEDYQAARLTDTEIPPMGNGFLDGVTAALLERGIDSPFRAAVFSTPVHAQVPDAEAAVRLVETASDVYDLDVDTGPLETFAVEVADHYSQLNERLREAPERERPDDRMFM
jgi:uncharacterized protein